MLGGFFVSVFVALTACVQVNDTTPFPDTKANHWVYVALDRQSFERGREWRHIDKPVTCADVVEEIVKAYGSVAVVGSTQPEVVSELNDKIKRLAKSRAPTRRELEEDTLDVACVLNLISSNQSTHEKIVDVERLVAAFSKDLDVQGLNSMEMEKSLKGVDKRLFVDAKAAKKMERTDQVFPDTNKNHWAFEAIARLRADGLISGGIGMQLGQWVVTRYDFAVSVYSAFLRLNSIFDRLGSEVDAADAGLTKLRESGDFDKAGQERLRTRFRDLIDETSAMGSYKEDIQDLKRLIKEFDRDITALGLYVPSVVHVLDSYDKPLDGLIGNSGKLSAAIDKAGFGIGR